MSMLHSWMSAVWHCQGIFSAQGVWTGKHRHGLFLLADIPTAIVSIVPVFWLGLHMSMKLHQEHLNMGKLY